MWRGVTVGTKKGPRQSVWACARCVYALDLRFPAYQHSLGQVAAIAVKSDVNCLVCIDDFG